MPQASAPSRASCQVARFLGELIGSPLAQAPPTKDAFHMKTADLMTGFGVLDTVESPAGTMGPSKTESGLRNQTCQGPKGPSTFFAGETSLVEF